MNRWIIALIVFLLFLVGCSNYGGQAQQASGAVVAKTGVQNMDPDAKNTVEMTSKGFNPLTLTIKKGETVTWVNVDSKPHRPATGPHPAHTGYPEMGGCVASKFDACRDVLPGENWSFTFNLNGSWGYHDHLNAATYGYGKIVVE